MAFQMVTFEGHRGGRKMRKRGSRAMQHICGCRLTSVRRKGGGSQPAIECPGSPMKKFVSREKASSLRGKSFCADMLRPIR